jgi:hypothetical protein
MYSIKKVINVCVFILIWLGIPMWLQVWPLGFFTWIPALYVVIYLNEE